MPSLKKIHDMSNIVAGLKSFSNNIDIVTDKIKGLSIEDAKLVMNLAGVNKYTQSCALSNNNFSVSAINAANGMSTDIISTTANTGAKTANLSITNMLSVAWAKLNAVIKANPFTAFLVVVTALSVAMGKLADRTYNAEKYAKEALDKSAEKVDTVKSEIESLNSELQITQSRIDELNAKENLSLVEQEELNRLKEANKELEREMRLKQSILSEEQKDTNKDAKKYFTTKKDSLKFESSYEGVEIHIRKLYQHFFRDKKKYAKEYDKYEQEYLQGMKSLYESALSGVTSILDKQINAYEDSKSAAVDSLEAERDARIEVLEAQKDQYEEQIKLIEKQIEEKESMIDDINEEIDAIRGANEERQRQPYNFYNRYLR